VEIVVTGRNVEVPDHFRIHVTEKVTRLERYDHKIVGLEVELFHEPNRRQLKNCQRVEITGRGCGPVARAEACAQDFYSALDAAVAKLEARLRRSHDRRRITGRRTRVLTGRVNGSGRTAVLEDEPALDDLLAGIPAPRRHEEDIAPHGAVPDTTAVDGAALDGADVDGADVDGADLDGADLDGADDDRRPGRIARRKVHTARPMSVDDALSRMELVGHDFYLFADAESGAPSVVYRRKGYDYGVIRLAQ
jgi:ribosomal subunit interface protein